MSISEITSVIPSHSPALCQITDLENSMGSVNARRLMSTYPREIDIIRLLPVFLVAFKNPAETILIPSMRKVKQNILRLSIAKP